MQVAIDNAKRKYDVDLPKEIDRINSEMNVDTNGLPLFWQITKKDKRKARNDKERQERDKANKEKIKKKINPQLSCPMNYLYGVSFNAVKPKESTLPMSEFFIKHEQTEHARKSKKVEDLIETYSLKLHEFQIESNDTSWLENEDRLLLMRSDFDDLIRDIKSVYISKNYLGLMSWLINRAFCIGSGVKGKKDIMDSNINKNKSILLKVLYTVNSDAFLACFKSKEDNNTFCE